ncbi:MAG: hypothetical protein HY262_00950 [Chloroflexi bacterium]|nr:hypothetical protein [Chloroflexota bacterium]
MTEPENAARARVDHLLERLARVNLQVVVIAPPDATRRSAQRRARAAAAAAGRTTLLEEAVTAARETVIRAFSRGGFSGTWAANDWSVSVASPRDRVAAAAAFEEAVMAEVVDDLVDDDTLEILRASTDELVRASGMPSPGALSSFTRSAVTSQSRGLSASLIVFGMIGLSVWFIAGVGLGLLTLAVGIALAVAGERLDRRS